MLELRELSANDGRDVYDLLQQMPAEENGLLNKAHGLTYDEYKAWLVKKCAEAAQEGLVDGWKVPSTTYWLYTDGVPAGFGNVRHFLTDALCRVGGNIGYGIAPRFRGRGYGNELLRLLLEKARGFGIECALVTIQLDNLASQAVALFNGGVIAEKNDERLLIWIDTQRAEPDKTR